MDYILQYLETQNVEYVHKWVEENQNLLHTIVHKMVRKHSLYSFDEEDLFSDAVILVYKVVKGFDPSKAKFSTYLYKALTNELLNHCKALIREDFSHRMGALSVDGTVYTPDGEQISISEIISEAPNENLMTYTMSELLKEYVRTHKSQRVQDVYTLYAEGHTLVTIAQKLHISKQAVSTILINLANEIREEWRVHE